MKKIASPLELTEELRSLVAYAEGRYPSREKLSLDLSRLSERVRVTHLAGAHLAEVHLAEDGSDWGVLPQEYEKLVRDFGRKAGADFVDEMGMNHGIHLYFHDWRDADSRPTRVGFNLMTLYKKYDNGGSFGIYTAFHNKSKNRLLTKEVYSADEAGLEQALKKFAQRLKWTVSALEKMKSEGVLVPNVYP